MRIKSTISILLSGVLVALALIALMFGAVRSMATQQAAVKPLVLKPCKVSGVEGPAKCGTYEVYENRATKKGRKISLNIVVLLATGANREPDPFIYIPGGPGSSATEDAPGIAEMFVKIRKHRDLLFVDQRGTGGSNPLNCDFFNPADPQSYFGYFFPLDDVRKCREQLEPKADLTLYTTSIAMDDFDEVRAALSYQKLNLFGASYGTRAALVYLRRHPESVRTVTLHGVSPTDHYMPADFPQQTERALQGVLSECAADEACKKAFPNLQAETKALLGQLIKGPVEVEVRSQGARGASSQQGGRNTVKLSRDLAAEAIRYMLYSSGMAPQIPWFLHQAAQGDFAPLAEAALRYRRNIVATGSNGMYLSVTCAEDVPWIKPGEGERLAKDTFLGDYRLRQQREACALWPRAQIESNYSEPVRSSLPVLIFTGQWDPVTPPSNGERVARYFSNGLHVVVPQGGHGFGGLEGLDCIERLNTGFVERGTVKGLDTSCVKNIRRKGFKTAM
jgi:pimeloyl-ACP methyl ester carboxylesterase